MANFSKGTEKSKSQHYVILSPQYVVHIKSTTHCNIKLSVLCVLLLLLELHVDRCGAGIFWASLWDKGHHYCIHFTHIFYLNNAINSSQCPTCMIILLNVFGGSEMKWFGAEAGGHCVMGASVISTGPNMRTEISLPFDSMASDMVGMTLNRCLGQGGAMPWS